MISYFKKKFSPLTGFTPLNGAAEKISTLSLVAPLTGGNVSLVQASLGTPWQIKTEDRFIFLEDVDEKPYRTLERWEHMRQAGIFKRVKAIFLFDFTFNEKNSVTQTQTSLYPKAFQQFAQEISVPVFKGTGVGHSHTNFPLYLGEVMHFESGNLKALDLLR